MHYSVFSIFCVTCLGALLASQCAAAADGLPTAGAPGQPADNAGQSAKPKHLLAYKFSAGETLRWAVSHNAVVETTIQGTTQVATTHSDSVKVWRVDDVSNGSVATVIYSVESVRMTNKLPNRAPQEYDSQKQDEPPPGFETVADAIGVPLTTMRINQHGAVLQREKQHAQSGSGDGPVTMSLPSEPVAVGHVWMEPQSIEVRDKEGIARRIEVRRRYELKKIDDGIATIEVEFQVLDPAVRNDPTIMVQLVQRHNSGIIEFDIEHGRVIKQKLDVDRRVLDFSGPSSRMHYVMHFTERLLGPEEKVAQLPATQKSLDATESPAAHNTPAEKAASLQSKPAKK